MFWQVQPKWRASPGNPQYHSLLTLQETRAMLPSLLPHHPPARPVLTSPTTGPCPPYRRNPLLSRSLNQIPAPPPQPLTKVSRLGKYLQPLTKVISAWRMFKAIDKGKSTWRMFTARAKVSQLWECLQPLTKVSQLGECLQPLTNGS